MNYNIIMAIGLTVMIFGFLGFIWCEMSARELDRKLAVSKQDWDKRNKYKALDKLEQRITTLEGR
jgi:hypothetical protein